MPRWKLESTDAVTSSISSRVITPSPFKSYKWNVHLKRVYMRKKLSVFLGVLYCGVQRITKRKLTYLVTWECFMNFDTLRLFHCALVQFNYRTRVRSLFTLVTNSLTHWLTHSYLVNLIDVILACEDGNSKLIEIVTDANIDDEDRVGNSLLHTSELRLGNKAKLLFRL